MDALPDQRLRSELAALGHLDDAGFERIDRGRCRSRRSGGLRAREPFPEPHEAFEDLWA
ncbi:MAG: hypothetical protein U1F17_04955 [Burkholderiaceae bacterium]